ncbi:MAG TPA: class I SAM-dependent methyltransferase [Phenylobacterium sp.]|nr:class I SAM-dependent methyltransferase [Phenylobacterium sp.]HQN50166.1 class I SAM-dependent methyltransferase [Phenylobacterium sp.]HQP18867.1 class I SAM-dependent methyltransferase [Phenylobacterium sp.]
MGLSPGHDPATLAFYDGEAEAYAAHGETPSRRLGAFLDLLPPGGAVLGLGCGGGQDAQAILARGFDLTPTDGSPGLAAQAQARIGRPVRIMLFEELDAVAAFDGVWANACLLHAPDAALHDILARIRRALKPGGWFEASFKAGDGEGRDTLGRYYNFPSQARLAEAYAAAGPWANLTISDSQGGGYDGVARTWLIVRART